MNMTFTAAASDYIKHMLEKEKGVGLRITIKKTGCSGYAYAPMILEKESSDDHVLVLKNGIKIYIDHQWSHLLEDITVDYVEDNKTGLKQKKLVFLNPKESGRCGCGESFHV